MRKQRVVKHRNAKRVVISLLLATVGVVVYALAYQYTYQAKLEAQYNQVQSELEAKDKTLLQSSKERQELESKLQQLEKELQAKKAEQLRIASLAQQRAVAISAPVNGTCVEWMSAAGIPVTTATTSLIIRESGCRPTALNPDSGACGIPQALPCSKLIAVCPNWQNDPVCQLRWMNTYVANRYGTWESAYSTWLSRYPHWY